MHDSKCSSVQWRIAKTRRLEGWRHQDKSGHAARLSCRRWAAGEGLLGAYPHRKLGTSHHCVS